MPKTERKVHKNLIRLDVLRGVSKEAAEKLRAALESAKQGSDQK